MEPLAVRKIDELGRVILPIKARSQLGLAEKDSVEISIREYTDEFGNPAGEIVIRRCAGECAVCGKKSRQLQSIYHVSLCRECFFRGLEMYESAQAQTKTKP